MAARFGRIVRFHSTKGNREFAPRRVMTSWTRWPAFVLEAI